MTNLIHTIYGNYTAQASDEIRREVINGLSPADRALRLLVASLMFMLPMINESAFFEYGIFLIPAIPFIAAIFIYLVSTGLSGSNSIFPRYRKR